jgi:hypothetical protein
VAAPHPVAREHVRRASAVESPRVDVLPVTSSRRRLIVDVMLVDVGDVARSRRVYGGRGWRSGLMAPRRTWSSTPSATSSEIRSSVSTPDGPDDAARGDDLVADGDRGDELPLRRRRFCWGRTSSRYMPTMSSGKMIRSMVASEG